MRNSRMSNKMKIGVCVDRVRFGDLVYAICMITWDATADSRGRNAAIAAETRSGRPRIGPRELGADPHSN